MENFEALSERINSRALDLLAEGVAPDDVSGAHLNTAIAILINSDGREATAAYLTDLAARIVAEGANG
tara:strand:+ start:15307 stop:15510 length:204 start_codon:yes stop_codon:yes gene_type:complete